MSFEMRIGGRPLIRIEIRGKRQYTSSPPLRNKGARCTSRDSEEKSIQDLRESFRMWRLKTLPSGTDYIQRIKTIHEANSKIFMNCGEQNQNNWMHPIINILSEKTTFKNPLQLQPLAESRLFKSKSQNANNVDLLRSNL